MKFLKVVLAVAMLVPVGVYPASADERGPKVVAKSDNVKLLKLFARQGGTELAAQGDFVYSGQLDGGAEPPTRGTAPERGGLWIHDVSGRKLKVAGHLHCPGNDNDVEVVRPGLVVMGFHSNRCDPSAGNGFMTIDVSNPRKPKILGSINTSKNHTLKPYPGKPIVYTAGGGLAGGPGAGPAIVDVSNPRKPEIVARPRTITTDCHDISFSVGGERKLMFCAGAIGTGEVQIYDVEDPLVPQLVGKIHNPLIQYSHFAVASSDGKLLAIDDEAFAAHDCNTGASPTGRVWIYDVSVPSAPILQSSFAPPRGGDGQTNVGTFPGWVPSWCLSHGLDWQPGAHNLGVTWFTGGWSVLDLSNPIAPAEVAFYQVEDAAAYSALWHGGRLYINDTRYGVQAFDIKELAKGQQ